MFGSVKNKIRWGTAFLFLLVILAGGTGVYYLVGLRLQSKNVLQDNYESLQYAHAMQRSLDSIVANKTAYVDSFAADLRLQEANVTEQGEAEITQSLRRAFSRLISGDTSAIPTLKLQLQKVLSLNMEAIQAKYARSEAAADDATTIIISVISLILLVGFTFVFNFPAVITDPIQRLTEAIKIIGNRNYSHRIHMQTSDEFGDLAGAFNEMAERLEYFENSNLNRILFEKKRAEAVINSLKDATIGIEASGRVLFANDPALQLLGLSMPDIIGMQADDLATRNDLFRFLLEEHGSAPFKAVVSGNENYFIRELIKLGEGPDVDQVIVLKNITPFKELDVAKTNFIATVSHELKTPLAASDFSLRLLEDSRIGQLKPEQQELVQSLKADNQRMLRILSELLNLTQVETGQMRLEMEAVPPVDILDRSVAAVHLYAVAKEVTLLSAFAPDLPPVWADREKSTWILNNLLTNAIKFATSGSAIDIKIDHIGNQVVFAVSDDGPGIAAEHLPFVFERYFQVPETSGVKGTGLGLSICKDLVAAMGGTIGVDSRPGAGSTFTCSLPVATNGSI